MQYLYNKIKTSRILSWILIVFLVNVFFCYLYYLYMCQTTALSSQIAVNWIPFHSDWSEKYIVYNSKCRIPDVNPWDTETLPFYKRKRYKSCSKKPLLTKIEKKKKKHVFLTVNADAEKYYVGTRDKVTCCYSNVSRDMRMKWKPDRRVKISNCISFDKKIRIYHDAIFVKCFSKKRPSILVYNNTHATTLLTKELEERKRKFSNIKSTPSVLLVGIDSISKLNVIRTLPRTSAYIERSNWIAYEAYNKVGYNTFPNLMALLTGRNKASIKAFANPYNKFLDGFNLIWKDFRNLGYVTAYAEDMAQINTFTLNKRGFSKQPTDFYYRHYTLASEKLLKLKTEYSLIYCAGPESYGERILNIARDFVETFSKQPSFGFFWMNTFSHDDINTPMMMDQKIVRFFRDIEKGGVMNHSIIIFLSDHGMRYGKIRVTQTGWLEERLPFLYFWIPDFFRKSHKREYHYLKENSRRLTTPFDLHMTLQQILVLSGLKHKTKQSISCPKCKSLLSKMPKVRSCADAGIEVEFCSCISYKPIDPSDPLVAEVARFVIDEAMGATNGSNTGKYECASLEVKKILHSRLSTNIESDEHKNVTYMLLMFETHPRLVLEATVRLDSTNDEQPYLVVGEIHRLDVYRDTGWCVVRNEYAQKYCYCKGKPWSIRNWFSTFVNKFFVNTDTNLFIPKRKI